MYKVLKDIFGRDLAQHIASFAPTVEDDEIIKWHRKINLMNFPRPNERISFTEYMSEKSFRNMVFVTVRLNLYVTLIRERLINLLELRALGIEFEHMDIETSIFETKTDIRYMQKKYANFFNNKNWLANFIIETYF